MQKTTAAVLLFFVVLSLTSTLPLPLHLADAVEDRQDALLNVWITAWDGHQLLSDPLHLFDANIFHPYPRTLAYSELLLGNSLLALPITTATGNPVLGYNVALLLSFVLTGLGTYLLVVRLTRSPLAGLVAGTVMTLSSYRMTNLAQAQLLTTQWMPFALLALHHLLYRPRLRHAVTFALFFSLQTLSSFYYGITLALAVVGYGLWVSATWFWLRMSRRRPLAIAFPSILHLALAACLCGLAIIPFALPYFQVQHELGFSRTLADSEPFSASLRQYLMVPPGSVIHSHWLPSDDAPAAGGYPVDALFPGLTAPVLAAWGLIRGRSRFRWAFLLILAAALVLSLGPRLTLAPGQPLGQEATLPYAWLYEIVPGFKALRAPVRFDALVTLALAVLAGFGVATVPRDGGGPAARSRVSLARLLPAGLLLLVLLESWVWPAARAESVPVADDVPPVYRWLADQSVSPILELPMAFAPGGPQLEYQYFSTYHWHTTPDGYSGFVPRQHGAIAYEMERFPSEPNLRLLQALGVRYVVVHLDRFSDDRGQALLGALSQVDEMGPVKAFGSDRVYGVQPGSSEPRDLALSLHFPSPAVAGEPYTGYLVVVNQGNRSYAIRPTDRLQPSVMWEQGEQRHIEQIYVKMPLVTTARGGVAVIAIESPAPSQPGDYALTFSSAGDLLGDWAFTGQVDVTSRTDARDRAFPVPARLLSWDLPMAAQPGGSLKVHLTWSALGKIDAYYSVYVKLLDEGGQAVVSWDGQPRDGEAPTLLWVPGETVDDVVTLSVPLGLKPGLYTVEAGMYRAQDLARCLTLSVEGELRDQLTLGVLQIGP